MTDEFLESLAQRFGTPTYVYDLDVITDRYSRLVSAFGGAKIHYAVKANGLGAILEHLRALGSGAEALTLGELERVLRAGFSGGDVILGGPGHTPALAARSLASGVKTVSLDSRGAWEVWRALSPSDTRFLVRVNPAFDPGTHEHLATAAAHSKFGVPLAEVKELAAEVAATGLLAGFHVHAGSMISDPAVADLVTAALDPLYRAFPDLRTVDLGGGYAVPDAPLEEFGKRMLAFTRAHELELLVEPGRYLVADAGVLLTRVLHSKGGAVEHVITDAGMADLLRPALYGAKHPIRAVGAGAPLGAPLGALSGTRVDVDGPLCENADRLGRDVTLPDVAPGALLAVEQAGAYGFAMASNYAGSLRPAEVVVTGGKARLARRREVPEDLWRTET